MATTTFDMIRLNNDQYEITDHYHSGKAEAIKIIIQAIIRLVAFAATIQVDPIGLIIGVLLYVDETKIQLAYYTWEIVTQVLPTPLAA